MYKRRLVAWLGLCLAVFSECRGLDRVSDLRPWEMVRQTLDGKTSVSRSDLLDLPWESGGGPEGVLAVDSDGAGGRLLNWRVKIDHHNDSNYPVGWPSFGTRSDSLDFSGCKALSFRIRSVRGRGNHGIRFVLKRKGAENLTQALVLHPGEWQEVVVPLPAEGRDKIEGLHFFLCEVEYAHGEDLNFQVCDFRTGEATKETVPLSEGLAGASLWVGERSDGDSRIVMLPADTKTLPAVLHVDNQLSREIPASAVIRLRIRDVFTGRDVRRELPLGTTVAARSRERIAFSIPLTGVPAGYAHVLADVLVDGVSVLGSRKGSDDFYLKRAEETELYAMLSFRAGMTAWIVDRLHGGLFASTHVALPHAYDPYDVKPECYREFLKSFANLTSKICEGHEAGLTGLALAADAFRRAGDADRQRFVEDILWGCAMSMMSVQDASGGVVAVVNELADDGIGRGARSMMRNCDYNTDQIAEWMRGLAYVSLHFQRRGGAEEKVRRINEACVRAGRFVVEHSRWPDGGDPNVIQKFNLTRKADGSFTRVAHRQEGRQCDVYQPRLLAGLSYTALALMQHGEKVPSDWWSVFDATTNWIAKKMKPDGWFDWQCEDVVEGGCHTFLGNIYAGEGLFGVGMANQVAGRADERDVALAAARKAYRYVTDACTIRGRRFSCPTEFWVGPYLCWLFAEWNVHVGHEPTFTDWVRKMDRFWRVERQWKDFLRLSERGVYRSDENGAISTSVLGYLALRQMASAHETWKLFDKIECVCVYYPHWHRYAKGDEWFGAERWKEGEWCFVKDASPRFPGHRQPLVPLAGYLDESNPKDMAKDIALAANAGIDVFLYDYYYYNGEVTQEAAIEKGFLGAANRNRMKFALMWCYHDRADQFRPSTGNERRRLMSLAHTREEFLGLIDLCIERYFPHPEYWRKDGRLFFSLYNATIFCEKHGGEASKIRSELDEARARVRAAGLGEVHFNAQGPDDLASVAMLKACGFDSVTDYGGLPGLVPGFCDAWKHGEKLFDYSWFSRGMRIRCESLASAVLPHIPSVPTGYDCSPRCRLDVPFPWPSDNYPYEFIVTNVTADAIRANLAYAYEFAKKAPAQPGAVYINGWNEYTEGTYLIPNAFDADARLRAVASVFGRHPANEYTFVNPSSAELLTVPAATLENIPYGSHARQRIDVWLPSGAKQKVPLIVYVHGGGWEGGVLVDKIIGTRLEQLLERGVAVACVGYRFLSETDRKPGDPPVRGCIEDVRDALAYLKSRADEFHVDLSRLALAGGSAGGCTSLILAYGRDNDLGVRAVAPVVPQTSMDPAEVRQWIPNAWYGADAFGYGNFEEWLAHRDDHPDWLVDYSPAALVRRIDPRKAPKAFLQESTLPETEDGLRKLDPTHSPVFVHKFRDICSECGLPIAFVEDPILALAESLTTGDECGSVVRWDLRMTARRATVDTNGVKWIDGKYLPLEGKAFADVEAFYDRLPVGVTTNVNAGVREMKHHAAGMQFRFATDSKRLALRWKPYESTLAYPNLSSIGASGIDVYRRKGGRWVFVDSGAVADVRDGGSLSVDWTPGEVCLVNLPLYNGIREFSLGIDGDASVSSPPPRQSGVCNPVVFYGTSITQGGCASRPGLSFVNWIGRELDVPVVNLGFSGSGVMELEMSDHLAKIDASCYVLDCLWNMRVKEKDLPGRAIETNYEPFIRNLHAKRPNVPIVMAEQSDVHRREPIDDDVFVRALYERLLSEGWSNLVYLSKGEMYADDSEGSVDGIHPNDLGMQTMKNAYGKAVRKALKLK